MDPEHLEARLRDLDWVSEIALAHEAVVEHFARARGAVVVPMKLFTMFSSMDKAIADVAAGARGDRARHAPHRRQRGVGRPDHAPARRGRRRQPASAAPGVGRGVPRGEEGRARCVGERPRGVAGGGGHGVRVAWAVTPRTRTSGRGGRSPAPILRFSKRRFS